MEITDESLGLAKPKAKPAKGPMRPEYDDVRVKPGLGLKQQPKQRQGLITKMFMYEISIWSKIWGGLQKKIFLRPRAGSAPEGGKTGPLAFISRETPSTRDVFVLKFLTFP